jgi:hypothetical protein
MNILSRDSQIQVIAALTEGMSIRSVERLTGIHRDTIMRLGARVGRGCAELHDHMMVGIQTGRLELDELWACVGKKQARITRKDGAALGDQYTFIALASSARVIVAYHTGKRTSENTDLFVQDLRSRVLGCPEISTDGCAGFMRPIAPRQPLPYGGPFAESVHVLRLKALAFAKGCETSNGLAPDSGPLAL